MATQHATRPSSRANPYFSIRVLLMVLPLMGWAPSFIGLASTTLRPPWSTLAWVARRTRLSVGRPEVLRARVPYLAWAPAAGAAIMSEYAKASDGTQNCSSVS